MAASLITTKQIQDGTIQVKDISKKAQKTLKGTRGATGAQGAQGPQGVAGPKGDKGDAGAPGAAGKDGANGADAFGTLEYARNFNHCTVTEGNQGSCTATCPDGLRPVGGGGVGEGSHAEQMEVNGSRPNPATAAGTGWTTFFDNNADTGASTNDNVTAYVVCAPATNVSAVAVSG